jgi:hypothetical protein
MYVLCYITLYVTTVVSTFIEGHLNEKRRKFNVENTPTNFIESILKVKSESEEKDKVILRLRFP